MPARLLLEIAIRVLGLWFAFIAVSGLAAVSYYIFPGSTSFGPDVIIAYVVPVSVQGLVGVMLIWWAPWLAARLYPADFSDANIQLNVGPGDIYRVACFVLGAYFLVQAAEPASRLVVALLQGSTWPSAGEVVNAVLATVYTVAGVLLVFGSHWIGTLLSNLRYDPDTIPKQQISLAVLLGLILFVGLILGAIRWLILR